MHTLYYSPGACSMAPHILLHELSIQHKLVRVFTGDEEHRAPAYLAVNPLGKIPTLERSDGAKLTEVVAMLPYLASLAPDDGLVPDDAWQRAKLDAIMTLIASQLHPAYALGMRPDRVLGDVGDDVLEKVRKTGRARFASLLAHLEQQIVGPYTLGDRFSIADPYVFVMVAWARYIDAPLAELPRLTGILGKLAARPSVQKVLRAESLIDENGRPTPPSRV